MALIGNFPTSGTGGRITFENYGAAGETLRIAVTPGTKYKLNAAAEQTAAGICVLTAPCPVTGYVQYAEAEMGGDV